MHEQSWPYTSGNSKKVKVQPGIRFTPSTPNPSNHVKSIKSLLVDTDHIQFPISSNTFFNIHIDYGYVIATYNIYLAFLFRAFYNFLDKKQRTEARSRLRHFKNCWNFHDHKSRPLDVQARAGHRGRSWEADACRRGSTSSASARRSFTRRSTSSANKVSTPTPPSNTAMRTSLHERDKRMCFLRKQEPRGGGGTVWQRIFQHQAKR